MEYVWLSLIARSDSRGLVINMEVFAQTFIKMLKNLTEKHQNSGAGCGHGHLVSQNESLFNKLVCDWSGFNGIYFEKH